MQQDLRVRTTAQMAGHPIHPMLVPIPIACFIGALQDVVTGFLDNQVRGASAAHAAIGLPAGDDFSMPGRLTMGLAQYAIVPVKDEWGVLHDGNINGKYATKESAFESAVAAASLALRQGHEVHVSVPGREAGENALGS